MNTRGMFKLNPSDLVIGWHDGTDALKAISRPNFTDANLCHYWSFPLTLLGQGHNDLAGVVTPH